MANILLALRNYEGWSIVGEDYNKLDWQNTEIPKPSKDELLAEADQIQSQIDLDKLRQKRNELILETDWWVLPDRSPTQAQLDYRQQLRDITQDYSDLDSVIWPQKPE